MFRSVKHIYAQVIDDLNGHTVVAASSNEKSASQRWQSWPEPKQSARLVAERAKDKGIKAWCSIAADICIMAASRR